MPEDIETWHLFLRAHDALIKRFEAALKTAHGLTIPQFDALSHLSRAPKRRLRMTELADAMLYSSGAATKVLDKLTAAGLVERMRDPGDRRVVIVALTPEGDRLTTRARRFHRHSIEIEFIAFLGDEGPHVAAFLERLTEHLRLTKDD